MANIPQLSELGKLRATDYQSINDLRDDLVAALCGVGRKQSVKRGVADRKLIESDGGTILAATDDSIGRPSVDLQQRQTMKYEYHGGIGTRQQARTDVKTQTVPAVVIGVNGTGADAEVTVLVVGNKPIMYRDTATSQHVPGNPLDAFEFGDYAQSDQYTIRMAGKPFASPGLELPVVGDTLMVTISRQSKKITGWADHNRAKQPMIDVVDYAPKATMVNGLCCDDDDGGGGGGGS